MYRTPHGIEKSNDVFTLHENNAPWRAVLNLGHIQEIPKDFVWHNNGEQQTFSFLEKGTIRLYCHTFSSRERIILQVGSGCLFREAGLLYTGQRYTIRQEALEPCVVYNFPASLLHNDAFIKEHPALIINLVSTLGAKLGAVISLLAESLKPSPEVMVGHYLFNFIKTPPEQRIQQGISQGELALCLGLHRSTVCRVLRGFRDEGVIGKVNRSTIEVLDMDYLQNLITT